MSHLGRRTRQLRHLVHTLFLSLRLRLWGRARLTSNNIPSSEVENKADHVLVETARKQRNNTPLHQGLMLERCPHPYADLFFNSAIGYAVARAGEQARRTLACAQTRLVFEGRPLVPAPAVDRATFRGSLAESTSLRLRCVIHGLVPSFDEIQGPARRTASRAILIRAPGKTTHKTTYCIRATPALVLNRSDHSVVITVHMQ